MATSEDKIKLGNEAAQLYNLLWNYFEVEARRMFNQFYSEGDLTAEELVEMRHDAKALNRLKNKLEYFIQSGKIEERKQDDEAKRSPVA